MGMKPLKAVIGGKGHNMPESGAEGRTLGWSFVGIRNTLREPILK